MKKWFLISALITCIGVMSFTIPSPKHTPYKIGVDVNGFKKDWTEPLHTRQQTASGCKNSKEEAGADYQSALNNINQHKWTIISNTGVFIHYFCQGYCHDYCYEIVYDDGAPLTQ